MRPSLRGAWKLRRHLLASNFWSAQGFRYSTLPSSFLPIGPPSIILFRVYFNRLRPDSSMRSCIYCRCVQISVKTRISRCHIPSHVRGETRGQIRYYAINSPTSCLTIKVWLRTLPHVAFAGIMQVGRSDTSSRTTNL